LRGIVLFWFAYTFALFIYFHVLALLFSVAFVAILPLLLTKDEAKTG
jgi:hypothetical protein